MLEILKLQHFHSGLTLETPSLNGKINKINVHRVISLLLINLQAKRKKGKLAGKKLLRIFLIEYILKMCKEIICNNP